MNINVYLPDELGRQAKEANLPLSRILREAIIEKLEKNQRQTELRVVIRELALGPVISNKGEI